MINWLKRNWAVVILIVLGVLWVKGNFLNLVASRSQVDYMLPSAGGGFAGGKMMNIQSEYYPGRQVAPTDTSSRLVIQNSSLSLQVKDVAEVISDIEITAKGLGGFLVNSDLSKPEGAASGTISVRVPENRRTEAMTAFKKMAVKVVSESVTGTDVTDQYEDLGARLDVLNKTKIKFEKILDKATAINDLLNVQRELISLQSQIDSVKGQQKYYEQSAKLSKVMVYLSTDELALPYAPTNEWRPMVIFKDAVRSLVLILRLAY
ncbi:MAG: coiled-coil protein [Microgenomates group bacterium GW2011_GWA2_40_6]|nr:MAG: coiled-coil protein [Microgenomates group bacterium GW2011_GWA2_40_6]